MTLNDFVQVDPGQFHGIDLAPTRGWIVAIEGEWCVVRVSSMRHPQCPFATFNRNQLTLIPELPVQRGSVLLS